jgi:hypothetical protein
LGTDTANADVSIEHIAPLPHKIIDGGNFERDPKHPYTKPKRGTTAKDKVSPDWIKDGEGKYYDQLVGNPELLTNAAEAFALGGTNREIADRLFPLGLVEVEKKTKIAKPLSASGVTRVRNVVKGLREVE